MAFTPTCSSYVNCNIALLTVGKFWTLHLLRDKPELVVFIVKLFPEKNENIMG